MGAAAILADVVGGKSPGDTIVKTIKIVAIVIAIFVIINVIASFSKKIKRSTTAVGDQMGGVITEQQTGVSIPRQQVCKEVAREIWDSLHYQNWLLYIEYWEEDERIRVALNRLMTREEAILTSGEFRQIGDGTGLAVVIQNRLDASEQVKVKPIILENLV